jgi:hypothetical protein
VLGLEHERLLEIALEIGRALAGNAVEQVK